MNANNCHQVGPAGAGKKPAKPGKRGRPANAKASPAGATAAQDPEGTKGGPKEWGS